MKKYNFTLILLFLLLLCISNVAATNNSNDFNKNITDNTYLIVISSNVDTVLNTVNNLINTLSIDINYTTLNKTVNKSNNHELSKFNNTTDINKSSVINVYPDTSNLVNPIIDKNNSRCVLFNDTLLNQNQFNKSFKVFELDKSSSVNDSISEELNSSKVINNISNKSRKDNPINHVSEPKQDKDYIILLIPALLALLGAIILYKKNK